MVENIFISKVVPKVVHFILEIIHKKTWITQNKRLINKLWTKVSLANWGWDFRDDYTTFLLWVFLYLWLLTPINFFLYLSNHSINHLKSIFKGEDLIQTEEVNELKVVFTVSFFVGNPVYELIRNTILITPTPLPPSSSRCDMDI